MTIRHHPSDETLARYAAGTLAAGPALVIATHLESCPQCRRRIAAFEAVSGHLLAECTPASMDSGAFDRALAALDAPTPQRASRGPAPARMMCDGIALPHALLGCDLGPWRWQGPGVHARTIAVPGDGETQVRLIRVAPHRKLPEHSHTGLEWTQLLSGSFSDGIARYMPGDIVEADSDVEHQPRVDSDEACLCLVALEGSMRLSGLVGRLLQPFVRL